MRSAVAEAASRRRRRELMARVWRIAPAAGGAGLVLVLAARWAGAPRGVPLAALAAAVAGAVLYILAAAPRKATPDGIAASIDADGRFGGELRSASWFAARETGDPWALFHLDRAAARLAATDWRQLYPPVRASRARWATAALLVTAVGLIGTWPQGLEFAVGTQAAATDRGALSTAGEERQLLVIPPDLRKRIEELLAAAEQGRLSSSEQKARALELYNLFTQVNSDVDPEKLAELARAMDPEQGGTAGEAAKKLWELAGKIQTAAEAQGVPDDVRKALADLGVQVTASAAAEDRKATEASQASAGSRGGSTQPGGEASSSAPPNLDPDSIQISKDSDAGAAAGMTMLSDMLGPKGPPGGGFGGGGRSGAPPAGGTAPGLADALRHETVEASADTAGQNVLSETRRQTERGQATAAFTHTAPGRSDRSLAGAPPPVPETRRATVQTYFSRQP